MDHQPEAPPTPDTLASTVRTMLDVEKKKAKQLPLTREVLLIRLRELQKMTDPEANHGYADELLLKYINDREITQAYDSIKKWYA